jgi:RNA polymerase sigma factor (sigma-70 family)
VEHSHDFPGTLDAARRGEGWALDRLAQAFYPKVERIVHHRLATDLRSSRPWLTARFSTGDVVQEVFHGVLRDLDSFAGNTEDAFAGFLAMVVRNRIIDAVRFHEADCRDGRRTGNLPTQLDLFVESARGSQDPADSVVSDEEVERLFEAMARFPERERLLLRARLENLASFAELAQQLGYGSESAARRAFYAAQAKLAIWLKQA